MIRQKILKYTDATLGALICALIRMLGLATNRSADAIKIEPRSVKRILLVRPGGMGDMIVLLPVLKHIRNIFPQASIDLVCEKRNLEVLQLAGFEQYALQYDENPVRFLYHLLTTKYDLAIDSEQFHNFSAIFCFLSSAPVRIGFKINPRRNPLYTCLINYEPDGPEGNQFLGLLQPVTEQKMDFNLVNSIIPDEKLYPPPDVVESMGAFAVIQPGAGTHYKRWPTENFPALAARLAADYQLNIALAGNKDDIPVCDRIVKEAGNGAYKCTSFAGKLDLPQTAALIRKARIFAGSDSGLAHLAVAMGVPSVVLFGPSDHKKWGTENGHHAIVRKDLPCSPCAIFGYNKPCTSIACMKQISVDEVMSAVGRVLKRQ